MHGGEIFVPRIPSTTVTDLATAIAPDAEIDIVGIRPGEKLHEEMISEDDSRRTYEFPDHYVIAPLVVRLVSSRTDLDVIPRQCPTDSPIGPTPTISGSTCRQIRQLLATLVMIPYGRQSVDRDDIAAVVEVLRGDWLTQGPTVERFEQAIADRVGARHAVAFSSGTAALHGAAFAAGWGPGDVVVTSPLTFMASANCARYVGARPALVDIDRSTFNHRPARSASPRMTRARPRSLRRATGRPPRFLHAAPSRRRGCRSRTRCNHPRRTGRQLRPQRHVLLLFPSREADHHRGRRDGHDERRRSRRALRRFRSHGIVETPRERRLVLRHRRGRLQLSTHRPPGRARAVSDVEARRTSSAVATRSPSTTDTELADLPIGLPPAAGDGFSHGYHLFPVLVGNRRAVYDRLQ